MENVERTQQIVALWILSTDSIHFVSSTVFRLFWSSDNCAVNERRKGPPNGGERKTRKFIADSFGPISVDHRIVSYQYAIVFRVASFCVWIPPELFCYFSIRRRVLFKLNMKVNFLCV